MSTILEVRDLIRELDAAFAGLTAAEIRSALNGAGVTFGEVHPIADTVTTARSRIHERFLDGVRLRREACTGARSAMASPATSSTPPAA